MKFNWKKITAITFAILGSAFTIADFATELWSLYKTTSTSSDFIFTIINFLVMGLVCFYLLSGNINSNYSAYNGMLMFIFLVTFNFAENFLVQSANLIGYFTSGDTLTIVLAALIVILSAGSVVTGVFSYLRTRQYLMRRFYNYKVIFVLSLMFTILTVLYSGLSPVLIVVQSGDVGLLRYCYANLADVCIALSVFFTVLRLNH